MHKIKNTNEFIEARKATLEILNNQKPEIREKTRVWHLDYSKLWYLTEKQGTSYTNIGKSETSKEYAQRMHDAETNCIERNMHVIIPYMQKQVSFLDLGCGEALKSIDIIKGAMKEGVDVVFYPVDVNERIIIIAKKNAEQAGIKTYPLLGDFERLDLLLKKVEPRRQRFFNLGANYVNFDTDSILSTIKSSMRSDDIVYFSAQISNSNNVDKIIREYNNADVIRFIFGTLENIGFEFEDVRFDTRFNYKKRRIESYVTVLNLPETVRESTMLKVGDELLVLKSSKPTLEEFEMQARKYFEGQIISNEDRSYVAFIGRRSKLLT